MSRLDYKAQTTKPEAIVGVGVTYATGLVLTLNPFLTGLLVLLALCIIYGLAVLDDWVGA